MPQTDAQPRGKAEGAFSSLRHTPPVGHDTAAGPRLFLAAAEIERYAALRQTVGYSHANRLLSALCARIRASLPSCEVGRASRNSIEFVFPAASSDQARALLMALSGRVGRGIEVDGVSFDLALTIGVAEAANGQVSDATVDLAETALAEAQRRRTRLLFAVDGELNPALERLQLIADLQASVDRRELQLVYQPKMRSRTATIDSAEALLRWHHPVRGAISPAVFIPVAEETGSIRMLTEWVVDRAIADRAALLAQGCHVTVDVNISSMLLPDLDFAAWLLSRLGGTASGIGFEITESAMISDPDGALANLRTFSEAGVRLAIDDYGSGFSSLSYLQRLPVNELKIDQSFISGLARSQRDPLLVRSTIDLAHALDMEVTAEGVDSPEALALLQVMGCDLVQGYLISRPLPLADFSAFVRGNRQRDALSTLPSIQRLRQRLPRSTLQS